MTTKNDQSFLQWMQKKQGRQGDEEKNTMTVSQYNQNEQMHTPISQRGSIQNNNQVNNFGAQAETASNRLNNNDDYRSREFDF